MIRKAKRVGGVACLGALLLGSAIAPLAVASIAPAPQDWDNYLQVRFTALEPLPAGVALKPGPRPRVNMTMLLLLARDHWQELSPATRNLISPWLLRPTAAGGDGYLTLDPAKVGTHDTTHFRIHYIDAATYTTDSNRATAAYVASVATELETVYSAEHTTLGYAAVPSDADVADNGGNGLYDVYLGDIGGLGIYGYASPLDPPYTSDAARLNGTASYLVLDNDYASSQYPYASYLDPLRVTAAHEYFHAIQMGYDWREQRAFMESSATSMEDIYPTIHDNYQYIGDPYTDSNDNGQYDYGEPFVDHFGDGSRDSGSIDYPELPLDSFNILGTEQYGRFVWVRFLEENFGTAAVRAIWEKAGEVGGDTLFSSANFVLGGLGSNLASAYQSYAVWGYDKGRFSDGANYPLVYVEAVSRDGTANFSSATSPSLVALDNAGYPAQMHLSTIYLQIDNPSGDYSFTATGGAPALTMLVDNGSGSLSESPVSLAAGSGSWSAPAGAVKAVAVVSNSSDSAEGMSWSLTSGSGTTPPPITPIVPTGGGGGGGSFGLPVLWLLGLGGLLLARRRRHRH